MARSGGPPAGSFPGPMATIESVQGLFDSLRIRKISDGHRPAIPVRAHPQARRVTGGACSPSAGAASRAWDAPAPGGSRSLARRSSGDGRDETAALAKSGYPGRWLAHQLANLLANKWRTRPRNRLSKRDSAPSSQTYHI